MRKIYRSQENRIIWGVFGGIGEYFGIDPAIFRLIGILFCIATGIFPFIMIYILAYFIIPSKKADNINGEIKKLYRSQEDKIVAGIFGGMGEYFDVDPTIFRLFALLLCISSAIVPFVILYIIAYFIIPPKNEKVNPISKSQLFLIIFILLLIALVIGLIFSSINAPRTSHYHFFERYGLEF